MSDFKPPKDNDKYRWTMHVVRKMRYYGLSPSRVLRVMRAPERVEEGVVGGTLAGMQTAGSKAKPWEVWVMWRDEGKALGRTKSKVRMTKSTFDGSPFGIRTSAFAAPRRIIITAWRYPGVSPVRGSVPIPSDVLSELELEGLLDL
jgi:hypothetical protein